MARFKVYLEYEGTRFSGWQAQKNARTVQGEIIGAMRELFNTDNFEFYGSGRTDAGVHAIAQVAHLEVQSMLAPEVIRMKVNDALPADINIIEIEKTHKAFHARHDAIARSYLYQISRRRTAFGKRYVWWIKDRLNFNLMSQTAELFEGMHDFRSFTADDPEQKSTKVKIDSIELSEYNDLILMRVVGSHFIWNLVRRLIGTIAEVGRGKLSIQDVQHFLKVYTNAPAQFTAPPSGLFLERVYYPGDEQLATLDPILTV